MHKENVMLIFFFVSVPEHKKKLAYMLPVVTGAKTVCEIFFLQAVVKDEEIPYGPLVQRKQSNRKRKKKMQCVRVTEGNKIERTKHQHC